MANKQLDYIIAYLTRKKTERFDGVIKIGIENGKVVSIGEANSFDITTSKLETDFESRLLYYATLPDFNGCIVFVLKDGVRTQYGFTRTYKGELLKRLLEEA